MYKYLSQHKPFAHNSLSLSLFLSLSLRNQCPLQASLSLPFSFSHLSRLQLIHFLSLIALINLLKYLNSDHHSLLEILSFVVMIYITHSRKKIYKITIFPTNLHPTPPQPSQIKFTRKSEISLKPFQNQNWNVWESTLERERERERERNRERILPYICR